MQNLTFSKPCVRLVVPDWPAGADRVEARFRVVEYREGVQQGRRTTTGRARFTPIGRIVRIVIGSDQKTYIVGKTDFDTRFCMAGSMRSLHWAATTSQLFHEIGLILR